MGDSSVVLADAQYGVAKILRPFAGFEAVYTGHLVEIPIAFSEGGQPLDINAGELGYAPNLLRGLSIPFGSRVTLYLPKIGGVSTLIGASFWFYRWRITQRIRNVFDFRQSRIPFHYPKQTPGAQDTAGPPKERARVIIPAAFSSIIYTQPDPGILTDSATAFLTVDRVAPESVIDTPLPLLPDGSSGIIQQGLLDPAISGAVLAGSPLFVPYEIPAFWGDELLLDVVRDASPNVGPSPPSQEWDFTTVDQMLSFLFGNGGNGGPFPNIGVYVFTGVASGPGQFRSP